MPAGENAAGGAPEQVNVFITSGQGTKVALSSPRHPSTAGGSAPSSSGWGDLASSVFGGEGLLKTLAGLPTWGHRRSDEAIRCAPGDRGGCWVAACSGCDVAIFASAPPRIALPTIEDAAYVCWGHTIDL